MSNKGAYGKGYKAVLGLVANKYLLNKVEELISRIEKLESNLTK